MHIYLDNCALGRLDDELVGRRLAHEAESVRTIVRYCKENKHRFVFSGWLAFEIGKLLKDQVRRLRRYRNLPREFIYVPLDEGVYGTAGDVLSMPSKHKLDPRDALHIASAIRGGAEYLISVDRGLLRWARGKGKIQGLWIVGPSRFLELSK